MKSALLAAGVLLIITADAATQPALQFTATSESEAVAWQKASRTELTALLMGGKQPERVPLRPELLQRIEMPAGGYALEELAIQTLPDRRAHVWMAVPGGHRAKVGAVLALHGHGGTAEQVVRGSGLYWYGRALAEMGWVVISPDIGQHELQHTNWSLMGERVWDALRCLDYLETRPEVDPKRMAVAGLSLGGETAMYVAALDGRVTAACSSGWLTTIQNMKMGHCPCWNFPGLEEHFDFSDIFALVAPRPLVLELGAKEKAPGGFPVSTGRLAFDQIRRAYSVFQANERLTLTVHDAGHVFNGRDFWGSLQTALGQAWPWREPSVQQSSNTEELLRRAEIARRCFSRSLMVYDGWWKTRDPQTKLYPRRLDQPVWAPNDNAADMLPFLFITAHYLAPERLPELLETLEAEKRLTSRLGALPDWWGLTNRDFVYKTADLQRLTFNAAEYCKDGLVPMTEVMGAGPWTNRWIELIDGIFERASIPSDFGMLPTTDVEVNGDLLQALARLYCITRNSNHLAWAERIADAYCFEVLPKNGGLPPHHWDFSQHKPISDKLNLNDHGNELIGGLAEMFVLTKAVHPEKAKKYEQPIAALFERLLKTALSEDGLWVTLLKASTAEVLNKSTPDTWGYALAAAHTFGTASGNRPLLAAVEHGLRAIRKPRYLDWDGADSYADSIEGGLLLLNRIPEQNGFDWLHEILPIFLGKQRDDGIVEGWYGDGNYARTAMMAGLYFTQGTICKPWRSDLQFGAVRADGTVRVGIHSPSQWDGRISFDRPRHRLNIRLPTNYARLNEFPEWYTVEAEKKYGVRIGPKTTTVLGSDLISGIPIKLRPGETAILEVREL